jgi:hypothetical protein
MKTRHTEAAELECIVAAAMARGLYRPHDHATRRAVRMLRLWRTPRQENGCPIPRSGHDEADDQGEGADNADRRCDRMTSVGARVCTQANEGSPARRLERPSVDTDPSAAPRNKCIAGLDETSRRRSIRLF